MTGEYCIDRLGARITYCQDYGKKDCPLSCFYARQVTEQLTIEKETRGTKGSMFRNKSNFDVSMVGE